MEALTLKELQDQTVSERTDQRKAYRSSRPNESENVKSETEDGNLAKIMMEALTLRGL